MKAAMMDQDDHQLPKDETSNDSKMLLLAASTAKDNVDSSASVKSETDNKGERVVPDRRHRCDGHIAVETESHTESEGTERMDTGESNQAPTADDADGVKLEPRDKDAEKLSVPAQDAGGVSGAANANAGLVCVGTVTAGDEDAAKGGSAMADKDVNCKRLAEAASVALAASATKARYLAQSEEKKIKGLVAQLVEAQLKKMEVKLKQFQELEAIMEREYEVLEQQRQQLLLDRQAFHMELLKTVESRARVVGHNQFHPIAGVGGGAVGSGGAVGGVAVGSGGAGTGPLPLPGAGNNNNSNSHQATGATTAPYHSAPQPPPQPHLQAQPGVPFPGNPAALQQQHHQNAGPLQQYPPQGACMSQQQQQHMQAQMGNPHSQPPLQQPHPPSMPPLQQQQQAGTMAPQQLQQQNMHQQGMPPQHQQGMPPQHQQGMPPQHQQHPQHMSQQYSQAQMPPQQMFQNVGGMAPRKPAEGSMAFADQQQHQQQQQQQHQQQQHQHQQQQQASSAAPNQNPQMNPIHHLSAQPDADGTA